MHDSPNRPVLYDHGCEEEVAVTAEKLVLARWILLVISCELSMISLQKKYLSALG